MSRPQPEIPLGPDDYLAWEQDQPGRNEYVDGEVFAMKVHVEAVNSFFYPDILVTCDSRDRSPRAALQRLVRPVAIRLVGGVLAAAQEHRFGFLGSEGGGRKPRPLVRTIAEGLVLAVATGTPEVLLARLELDGIGRFLGDVRLFLLGHGPVSAGVRGVRRASRAA
jgi:hypothetical protein